MSGNFSYVLRLLDTTVTCWALPIADHARRPPREAPSPFPNTDRLMHSYTYAPQVLHAFGNALWPAIPHIPERVSERICAVQVHIAGVGRAHLSERSPSEIPYGHGST